MIRRIMILGLLALSVFIFYETFMAETLESFFKRHSSNVDLLQIKTSELKVNE